MASRSAGLLTSPIWKERKFVLLWIARCIMLIGSQVYQLALPWMVYDLTKSGTQMAFVPLAIIFGLYNFNLLEVWHIYIASFILSSLVAIVLPAFESSIPTLVKQEDLVSANALTEMTNSLTSIIGPLVAAAVIATLGVDYAILLNGIGYILAACIFIGVKMELVSKRQGTKFKDILHSFSEGLSYVPRHPLLRWGVIMSTSNNIVLGAYMTLLIFHMRHKLHLDENKSSLVITISSVVSIVVSMFLAPRISKYVRKGKTMVISLGVFGCGVVFVGFSAGIFSLILSQALYSGAITLFQINWLSLRQTVTPPNMMGRVSGTCRGIAYFGASIGAFLGGFLLKRFDVSDMFIINGGLVILIAVLTSFVSPLFRSDITGAPPVSTSEQAV